MPPQITAEVVEYRLRALEDDRKKFSESLETLGRMSANIEEIRRELGDGRVRMKETDGDVDAVSERVSVLENALPILQLTSRWVIAGVLGIFALVSMAVYRVVLHV